MSKELISCGFVMQTIIKLVQFVFSIPVKIHFNSKCGTLNLFEKNMSEYWKATKPKFWRLPSQCAAEITLNVTYSQWDETTHTKGSWAVTLRKLKRDIFKYSWD